MKYFLLLIIPLLTNGAHILPSLFKFDPPTVEKLICSEQTNQLELKCFNSGRLKVKEAKSGSQSRDVCSFHEDLSKTIEGSCHESELTLKFLKEKCDSKDKCLIKLDEPIPNNCTQNTSNYVQVTYQCATSFLPFRPFLKERIGIDFFKSYSQFQDEKRWRDAYKAANQNS